MLIQTKNHFKAAVFFSAFSAAFQGGQLLAQEINIYDFPHADHKMMLSADALRGLANGAGAAGNGIFYHGGPVMLGTPNVYLIWYGSWPASSKLILTNLASSLGGSPYLQINSTYYDGASNFITGNVALSSQTTDNYSQGNNLSDAQIQTVVANAIVPSGTLPLDPQGIYFVMTWTDVTATSGFCTQYCGWHAEATIKGQSIKFAFIGNAAVKCPRGCIAQTASPNNDPGADGAASVFTHELEEAMTDPNLNAWYDNIGNENADKCAWTFGTMYTTPNGAKANVNLGGLDYLIQQNWVNAAGGFCAMSFNNSAPVLTSAIPNTGAQGATVNVTLGGSNFISGATVGVSGTGVSASNVTVVSATQITATLTVAASATAGAHNLSVTTANGTSGAVTFNVTSTAPTVTSLAPNSGTQGATVNVTLTGTNFLSGASVAVSGIGVTASNVTVVNATQITATLSIGAAAAVGSNSVSVTTSTGTSNAVPFTVNAASSAPVLSSITPNSGAQGSSVNVTLTGTNFTPQSQVRLAGTGATQTNVVVVSTTQITATFSLAATTTLGTHNAYVVTAAGNSNILPFNVTGSSAAPTVSAVAPNSGIQGTTSNVTVTGTNFIAGATIGISGSGVTASNVSVVSATQISATFTIAASAATGGYNVTVTTSGGSSNAAVFTVNPGSVSLVLSSVTPNSGAPGSAVNVTLAGSGFVAGATVGVTGSGVVASNVALVSPTQMTATLTIGASASPGAYGLSVTTSGGTSNTAFFTVTGVSQAPLLSSATPNSGLRGTSINVTLDGANFTPTTTVRLAGIGASQSNVVVVSSTQITFTVTLSGTAAAGVHNISVVNASGTSNVLPFTAN